MSAIDLAEEDDRSRSPEVSEKSLHKRLVWDHWTVHQGAQYAENDIMKCNYCNQMYVKRNFRCRKHLATCEDAPPEVREMFGGEAFEKAISSQAGRSKPKNASKPRSAPRRKKQEPESDESDDCPWKARKRRSKAKEDTMSFFTDLLGEFDERPKKPFAQYTEDDWLKEERELLIRERRARVQNINSQTQCYNAFAPLALEIKPLLSKINEAADLFIIEQKAKLLTAGVEIVQSEDIADEHITGDNFPNNESTVENPITK